MITSLSCWLILKAQECISECATKSLVFACYSTDRFKGFSRFFLKHIVVVYFTIVLVPPVIPHRDHGKLSVLSWCRPGIGDSYGSKLNCRLLQCCRQRTRLRGSLPHFCLGRHVRRPLWHHCRFVHLPFALATNMLAREATTQSSSSSMSVSDLSRCVCKARRTGNRIREPVRACHHFQAACA